MIGRNRSGVATIAILIVLTLVGGFGVLPVSAARDRIPPTAPTALSVTNIGSTHVSLAWTASTDDQPFIFYQVFVNGSPSTFAGQNTSATVIGLTPSTTYTFTVKARD